MRDRVFVVLYTLLVTVFCAFFSISALAQDEPAPPPEEKPEQPAEEKQLPPDDRKVDVPVAAPTPLVTILTYLQKELGINLTAAPELEEKEIKIMLVGVPWRKALDEVAARAGGKVVQEGPNHLKIVPADAESPVEEQPEEAPEETPEEKPDEAEEAPAEETPAEETTEEEEKPAPKKTTIPCPPAEYVCGKGFVWKSEDGDYSLRIGGRLQFHWILDNYDIHRPVRPEHSAEFGIPRAYLFISGNAFRDLKYSLAYRIDKGIFDDWKVTWTPTCKSDKKIEKLPVDITLGHFKPVFSREFLTSSGGLSMVNRNLADAEFRLGRDYGVNVTTKLLENKLKFDLGFFNGLADSSQDNTGFRATTKLQLDLNKPPKTQGDLAKLEKPALSLGLAYSTENDVYDFDMNGVYDDNASRWTADIALYWQGFNILAAYFSRTQQNAKTSGPGDPYEKALRSTGYSLQASYFLVKSKLELVALMSFVEPDVQDPRARHGATSGWQHEMRFGIGYYISGHTLKLQLDWGTVRERQTHGSLDDHQLRVQFTMGF